MHSFIFRTAGLFVAAERVLKDLTFFGILHAHPSIAVETRRTSGADVPHMRRSAVDTLDPGEAGPAGTRSRHIHSQSRP